jgi:hypothetical protein
VYKKKGFYLASQRVDELPQDDGTMQVVYEITENRRVAVSQIVVEGNDRFEDGQIAGQMKSGTEGFFWWKKGDYDEERLERDVKERLPEFYGSRGYIDFQVLRDTLSVHERTGKGTLILAVDEGATAASPRNSWSSFFPLACRPPASWAWAGSVKGRPSSTRRSGMALPSGSAPRISTTGTSMLR